MERSTSGAWADGAALMDRCAARDVRALGELYDRTSAPVYRLCLCVVGTGALAEEATTETYRTAWREAGSFVSQRLSLDAWLLTIARRAALAVAATEGGSA
ncbi:hypothetical protein G5V58_11990 [Nocardioides anomalus]|uniref:RNA polymerase sigma-70 region 2 domain-containing protein n=1 Tax=Nocardioides anomalus TaxID=2712223 RepID=A0A6G6WEC4_9ACTN|nr:sigma factor [Nocardioides anomalus]QIG43390.1 hypothetical protein G5V58_11990 [Nocardioides anomalus]